ncbi:MAG: oligosaccharide flippase family protein, partial [Pisciglobus halotolerans]|nr:oligosaccharide flippase family protein [Pisciglobus halotolerans]
MSNREIKKMMNGALLLTAASFIAKLLSAVYRVPFQNLVGNTGFYAYQQVYPLYGLGMTLALSGLPVFLSKVIAESSSISVQKKTAGRLSALLGIMAVLLFLLLYFGANFIGEQMGDQKLKPIIQMVSWQFLFIPFLAVSRGFFQGRFQMTPTAVSQVVEQVVRVAVILSVAYLYTTGVGTVYRMASSAMSSAWIAAIAASAVMIFSLFLSNKREKKTACEEDAIPSYKLLLKRLGTEGLTICLLSAVLIIFQLIDSFTLYKGLIESG